MEEEEIIAEVATYQVITPTQDPTEDAWVLTPLYKVDATGKDAQWQVGFDGVDHLIMLFGKVGGKIRPTTTEVTPKGKRNMQQQALQEARHRYDQKFTKEGYRPIGEDIPEVPEAMLANKWIPGKTKLKFPVWAQPKLDGIRMLARDEHNEVIMRSRGNKTFPFLPHIRSRIKNFLSFLPKGAILDGELYSHLLTFNAITSIVKRTVNPHPQEELVEYYIFDLILPKNIPFNQRYQVLLDAYNAYSEAGYVSFNELDEVDDPIRVVGVTPADSEQDLHEFHDEYVQLGYEGLIIRKIAGDKPTQAEINASIYKFGRSSNMLKYKEFIDEEAEVIGVEEARGTEVGTALLRVRDIRGNEIVIRFRAPLVERRKWLQDPNSVIGKQATIRYQELSPDGVPRFPVGVAIRDYE